MAAGPSQGKLRPHYRLILYNLICIRSIEKMYMNQEGWGIAGGNEKKDRWSDAGIMKLPFALSGSSVHPLGGQPIPYLSLT